MGSGEEATRSAYALEVDPRCTQTHELTIVYACQGHEGTPRQGYPVRGALFRSNSDPALIEYLFHLTLQGLLPGCELLSCPKDWPRQYVVRLT